ncbi:MAG: hypothetical protein QM773_17575 [Hyphomonadaceae bacterium]
MVTLNLKLYAAPVALLMMTIPLAAPKAFADPVTSDVRPVTAAFAYNPAAPVSEIYADLARTADYACTTPGPRPLSLRKLDDQCAADLLAKAVERIGRTDIAAMHDHTPRG